MGGWQFLSPWLPSPSRFCFFGKGGRLFVVGSVPSSPVSLSHQTTKFPPTPSIPSTSPRLIRMIKLWYCTLTVIQFPAILIHVYPEPRRVSPTPSSPSPSSL